MKHFCINVVGNEDSQPVTKFYEVSGLDTRIPVSKSEFINHFGEISKLDLFSFIPKIAKGFKDEYLNINSDISKNFAAGFKEKFLGDVSIDAFKNFNTNV